MARAGLMAISTVCPSPSLREQWTKVWNARFLGTMACTSQSPAWLDLSNATEMEVRK